MVSLRFQYVWAVMAVLGFSNSQACTQKAIMSCVEPLKPYMDSQSSNNHVPEKCTIIETAINCYKREVAGCPESMKSIIEMTNKVVDQALAFCKDPGSVDLSMGDCNTDLLQKCSEDVGRNPNKRDPKAHCLKVGTAQKCIEKSKVGCKSELLSSMLEESQNLIDDLAQECRDHGYSLGNNGDIVQPTAVFLLLSFQGLVFLRHYIL